MARRASHGRGGFWRTDWAVGAVLRSACARARLREDRSLERNVGECDFRVREGLRAFYGWQRHWRLEMKEAQKESTPPARSDAFTERAWCSELLCGLLLR